MADNHTTYVVTETMASANVSNLTIFQTNWEVHPPQELAENCSSNVNEAELEMMMTITHGIIIPILAAVGIILNVINLIVLSNGRLKESSYTYLTGLAFADLVMLILFLVNGIGRGNFPKDANWRYFEAFAYFPLGFMLSTVGALITVTVSVERFVFIYKPMMARVWCTRRIARIVITVLWIVCIALNIPRFFVFHVNKESGTLEYTIFGRSSHYQYLSWFQLLVISCGCGLALIVINILLIQGIKNRSQSRREALGARNTHQRSDDIRLTWTLISIVFIFLMGEIPSALSSRALVVGLSGNQCVVGTKTFKIISLISTILIVLQLSLNFVVYCALNRRFSSVFKEQLCPCSQCKGEPGENNNQHAEMTSLHSKITLNNSRQNGLHLIH